MAQLIHVGEQATVLKTIFAKNHDRLIRMAPKTGPDPNRLLSVAFSTVIYDSGLVRCTPESLFGCVMESLRLGLLVGGPAQEAWVIPFRNKTGGYEATFIIGYQGYRSLIDRAKTVIDLHPRAVYEHDEFDLDFGANRIRHKPYWLLGAAEPGSLVAVYAIAHLRGGGMQLEVMPKAEVDQHRARSRASASGPWVTDYDAMALKTVVRKIAKYLPKSSELLSRALDLDQRADLGLPQPLEVEGLDLSPSDSGLRQTGGTAIDRLKARLALKAEPAPAAAEEAPAMTVALDPLGDALGVDEPAPVILTAEEHRRLDLEIADRDGQTVPLARR